MITGVFIVLIGEAALFGSVPLVMWAALFAGINVTFIPLFEEPRLAERFGASYEEYRRHVPRWIPRSRPWSGEPSERP